MDYAPNSCSPLRWRGSADSPLSPNGRRSPIPLTCGTSRMHPSAEGGIGKLVEGHTNKFPLAQVYPQPCDNNTDGSAYDYLER